MKKYYVFLLVIVIATTIYSEERVYFSVADLNNYKTIMLVIDPSTGEIKGASQGARNYYGYSNLVGMNISEINQLTDKEVSQDQIIQFLFIYTYYFGLYTKVYNIYR